MIEPAYSDELAAVYRGEAEDVLPALPEASVDAVVTDAPYSLGEEPDIAELLSCWLAGARYEQRGGGFMGEDWDVLPDPSVWRMVLRVLKPGGHALVFAGTRTADLVGIALRLAGFEIRDEILDLGCRVNWLYGSGFPKSLDVGRAIDSEVCRLPGRHYWSEQALPKGDRARPDDHVCPASSEGDAHRGQGTGLKPAHEPILVARRPLSPPTVAANVLAHGTGALQIDRRRLHTPGSEARPYSVARLQPGADVVATGAWRSDGAGVRFHGETGPGRWPANVALSHAPDCQPAGVRHVRTGTAVRRRGVDGGRVYSRGRWRHEPGTPDLGYAAGDGLEQIEAWECVPGCPVAELDRQSGVLTSGAWRGVVNAARVNVSKGVEYARSREDRPADSGGASRFLYVAKPSAAERNAGLGPTRRNDHPTVKPVELMRWLIGLVTPPGGLVLDCYAGTGSTLVAAKQEGLRCIGVERKPAWVEICADRLRWARHQLSLESAMG